MVDSSPTAEDSWTPNPNTKWQFDIDVVGTCNLRCPSCPVGNSREAATTTRYMRPDMLDQIIRKAKSECQISSVYLYNWTEPFLHPNLAEMIRVVRSHGPRCGLSTNLNIMRDIDDVMAAGPHMLKVSVSGFTQENYGQTHVRGDIETVKNNMAEVARAKARTNADTRLVVAYHRYLGNHDDEQAMYDYCQSLGFEFEPAWAYFMPLEKVLSYVDPLAIPGVSINDDDRALINRLALPLDDALDAARNTPGRNCRLRDKRMALTAAGDVMLCCTTFDQSRFKLTPYLDQSLDDIQAQKFGHEGCKSCMRNGLHNFFTYDSNGLDAIALKNVHEHYPDAKLLGVEQINAAKKPRGMKKVKREINRVLRQIGLAG